MASLIRRPLIHHPSNLLPQMIFAQSQLRQFLSETSPLTLFSGFRIRHFFSRLETSKDHPVAASRVKRVAHPSLPLQVSRL